MGIRISLGHPESATRIESLKSREAERKKKHARAVKERAEVLRESSEATTKRGLTDFFNLIRSLSDRFDGRILLEEIVSDSGDDSFRLSVRGFTWPDLMLTDLPQLEMSPFRSAKKTPAHVALFKARDVFFVKIKTSFRRGLNDIKDEETQELGQINRWTTYWKLQIADVLSCFEDR